MLGMHGTYEANNAMHDCDLLINIGARFDDRITGKLMSSLQIQKMSILILIHHQLTKL
jgi:thiamine pyrophosphate-dependent acetolactate synthase large subunit-like protein